MYIVNVKKTKSTFYLKTRLDKIHQTMSGNRDNIGRVLLNS